MTSVVSGGDLRSNQNSRPEEKGHTSFELRPFYQGSSGRLTRSSPASTISLMMRRTDRRCCCSR